GRRRASIRWAADAHTRRILPPTRILAPPRTRHLDLTPPRHVDHQVADERRPGGRDGALAQPPEQLRESLVHRRRKRGHRDTHRNCGVVLRGTVLDLRLRAHDSSRLSATAAIPPAMTGRPRPALGLIARPGSCTAGRWAAFSRRSGSCGLIEPAGRQRSRPRPAGRRYGDVLVRAAGGV